MTRTTARRVRRDRFDIVRVIGLSLPNVEAATKYDGSPVLKLGGCSAETKFAAPCIPIPCDHTDDTQVESVFFSRIDSEHGRLDVLVNSVWGGYEQMFENGEFTWSRPFWQQPVFRWDSMFLVAAACAERYGFTDVDNTRPRPLTLADV